MLTYNAEISIPIRMRQVMDETVSSEPEEEVPPVTIDEVKLTGVLLHGEVNLWTVEVGGM